MTDELLELARGSGNVYRDLGKENPDVRQLKALLAAEIIKCWTGSNSPCARRRNALLFRLRTSLAFGTLTWVWLGL